MSCHPRAHRTWPRGTTPIARTTSLLLGSVLLHAATVSAQPAGETPTPRVFVGADGGYQATAAGFTDQVRFRLHAEDSTFDATYEVKPGPLVDVRARVRLWRRLGAGAAVAWYSTRGSASARALLPHPFFFNRPRDVAGEGSGFAREAVAIHFEAGWAAKVGRRLVVVVFGGPSYFRLQQDLVERVDFTESYPYDTATFAGLRRIRRQARGLGVTAGADVGYFFTARAGVGALLRFSRAALNLPSPDQDRVRVDAGGAQVSGGLRLRF